MLATAIRGMAVSLGMTLCLTAVASGDDTDVVAKLAPDVTIVPSVPPTQSLIDPTPAAPCNDQTCGLRALDDAWKRGVLPPGFRAYGANDFEVENAGSVILGRAKAAETESSYAAAPPKFTYKLFGLDCEIASFVAGGQQEGGTRCAF